jgi:3-hydroxybutyryl-CoA dehydrogenase
MPAPKRLDAANAAPKNSISMTTKRMGRKVAKSGKDEASSKQRVGIIGLGLMGQGIAACLLAYGYEVVGFDTDRRKHTATTRHVTIALAELKKQKLVEAGFLKSWKSRLHTASSLADLALCGLIIECVREDLELKCSIFAELEAIVPRKTIIASNTSSLPISLLQAGRVAPGRYIGMHWGEPAQIMRYLEIIPGKQTSKTTLQACLRFGVSCGKEPAVLKQDVRGFLSNRLMYAMLREACYLVESGVADVETVDQSFRNDIGWWALLAGPFRWMDLTGIPAYAAVMEGLLPELSTGTAVPAMMQRMVKRKAFGIANQKGFYPYTKATVAKWEKDWVQFTYDMRKLAERYTPKS